MRLSILWLSVLQNWSGFGALFHVPLTSSFSHQWTEAWGMLWPNHTNVWMLVLCCIQFTYILRSSTTMQNKYFIFNTRFLILGTEVSCINQAILTSLAFDTLTLVLITRIKLITFLFVSISVTSSRKYISFTVKIFSFNNKLGALIMKENSPLRRLIIYSLAIPMIFLNP
jgi:hypothetical protein